MKSISRFALIFLLAAAVWCSAASSKAPERQQAPAADSQFVVPPTTPHQPPVLRASTDSEIANGQSEKGNSIASALAFSKDGFDWRCDWWKALIILVVLLGALALFIRLAGKILRFIGWILCLVFAGAVSYMFTPELTAPFIERHATFLENTHIPPLYWAYALTFIIGLFIATLGIIIIRKPFDATAPKKDSQENG